MSKATDIEIKQALADLEDEHGRVTPEAVVRAASDAGSVLHDLFEWNDDVAAHYYRIDQARTLIRSVRVEFRVEKKVVRSIAYVHDPVLPAKEQGYRAVTELRRDPDAARSALVNEFSRVAAHLRRARELATALSLEGEVDDLLNDVGALRTRVEEGSRVAA